MSEDFASKLNQLEEKWQKKWESHQLFESDPSSEEKFYITVAYPYPSGGMHVGHVRSYALPDVFARYKRMNGYNVLFPMAWHVTGTPIIGALERLKEGEEKQLEVLKDVYKVPEDALENMEEPMDYARYFIENSYKPNMEKLGFSIDWRREFTTNDEQYHKFIEWQYRKLREKGLVKKGMHPTKYDLKTQNPVTTHDLLEGENADKQEYNLVKFESEDYKFPCATLRPETVYGVTHVLINPAANYKVAEVDGEKWILSNQAAVKLEHQGHEVRPLAEEKGEEFVGDIIANPITGEEVMILPADFVDPDSGSGIVMSVPAHAPYDWISLQDLKQDQDMLVEYGIEPMKVRKIEPKQIINVEGYSDYPAKKACEEYGVESQDDTEALEEATEEVYEKEFHKGTLNAHCGEFSNDQVSDVKDRLAEKFREDGKFSSMYDFSEKVVSRSGGKVIVSLEESWFLEYGDRGWKDKVHDNLDMIDIIPGDKRSEYNHAIDWLESWPCIRNYGLGTKLPFDPDFIVEPLSDSTIYMAFYTIRNVIDEVEPGQLSDEFFDYVFNEEGDAAEIAQHTGIEQEVIEEARESFEYWYPLDYRTSAHDLVQNHLTFMMYHHTQLFQKENWPRGIATWGMGLLEGEKMSSSKGHVVLPDEAINEYGADTVRLFLFASAEPWQDFDWRAEDVKQYRDKLKAFYDRSIELYDTGQEGQMSNLDRYALSRLQTIIENTAEALEGFQTRKAGLNAFFELNSLINKYRRRSEEYNKGVMNELIETQVKLLSPFTPHLCDELWSELGKDGFVSEEEWPEPVEDVRDEEVEASQQLIDRTLDDIRELDDIVDDYDEIKIIVADDWKRELFEELIEVATQRPEFGEAMGRLTQGREQHAEQIKAYLQDYIEEPGDLPGHVFTSDKEEEILEENEAFLEREFDKWVTIEKESESTEKKASRAEPGRPAIVME